ncbi:MAG TPA: phosphotransferase, partial [Thermomicrobiales bacterium]|nr:phosphotransferase [Thermomicrobiales bacterium]
MSQSIDPHAILVALGIPHADAVTPVLGGKDAALFRVERGKDAFALRIFRPGDERVLQFEAAVMRAAGDCGIPVPAIHASVVSDDRPALLLEWRAGRTVVEEAIADPARAEPLGIAAGRMLARLHQIEPHEWIRERSWLDWFAIPDTLARALTAVAGPPRLLHLDYHPLNLLTDGAAITAILDWTNARAGDPRADLARALAILALNTGEAPVDVGSVVAAFE